MSEKIKSLKIISYVPVKIKRKYLTRNYSVYEINENYVNEIAFGTTLENLAQDFKEQINLREAKRIRILRKLSYYQERIIEPNNCSGNLEVHKIKELNIFEYWKFLRNLK